MSPGVASGFRSVWSKYFAMFSIYITPVYNSFIITQKDNLRQGSSQVRKAVVLVSIILPARLFSRSSTKTSSFFAEKYTFRQSVYENERKNFGKVHFEAVDALLLEFESVRTALFKDKWGRSAARLAIYRQNDR